MCDDSPSPAVSVIPGPSTVGCCFSFPVPSRLHEGIAFSLYGKPDYRFLASNQTKLIPVYWALRLALCVIETTMNLSRCLPCVQLPCEPGIPSGWELILSYWQYTYLTGHLCRLLNAGE